jgi:hypothetical protein
MAAQNEYYEIAQYQPVAMVAPTPSGASTSTGTGGVPTSVTYAGPPLLNPPTLANIVVDSAGRVWVYYASSWH